MNIRFAQVLLPVITILSLLSASCDSSNVSSQNGGVIKLANSWGKGYWENTADGFLYITYEALKANNSEVFLMLPRTDYVPQLFALFKISHPKRGNVQIQIRSSSKTKKILGYNLFNGGNTAFPTTALAVDITELLPLENQTITLEAVDSTNGNSGIIKSFSVEKRDLNGGLIESLSGSSCNIAFTGTAGSISIEGISAVKLSSAVNSAPAIRSAIMNSSRPATPEDLEQSIIKAAPRASTEGGYGRGLVMPDKAKWQSILSEQKLRVINTQSFIDSLQSTDLPACVDCSASIYFPPIGNQGSKGSCTAWSIGYYIASFYQARRYGWDISGAKWVWNGSSEQPSAAFQSHIMSPDFLYSLVNDGYDSGSYFCDIIQICSDIGICSWERMPYSQYSITDWGNESAWREAASYRCAIDENQFYMKISTDEDIIALKALLNAGYLLGIAVESDRYRLMTQRDVLTSSAYTSLTSLDHANTIVGYDDDFAY